MPESLSFLTSVGRLLASLSYVVDLQYGRRLSPHLLAKGRILGERLTVRRNHSPQFRGPRPFLELFRETSFENLNHDRHCRRGTRRSTQQGDEGMVGGSDQLRAKFQNAAVRWILFDNLHALPGDFDPPIRLLRIRIQLAERGE